VGDVTVMKNVYAKVVIQIGNEWVKVPYRDAERVGRELTEWAAEQKQLREELDRMRTSSTPDVPATS
jgi:hypothetical protein